MIGTTIKDFKLVERLGKGGWGEVWAAEQPIVKTRVAIKLLRSDVSGDEAHIQRFFNEAIAVGGIAHAGIVKIYDVGFVGEQAFLIMELLTGEALTSRIRRERQLPADEVLEVGRQIASVLAATHEAGVVHRDLKPDNVFLVPDAELGERVKVLDFGIAKLATVNVTGTGSLGTPAYMAPEQWNNPAAADHRADLYSLGCVLFEMCCGRPPFLASTPGEACTKHLSEPPPRACSLAPATPPALDALIDALLSKEPAHRPGLVEVERVLATAALDRIPDAPRRRLRPRGSILPIQPLRALGGNPADGTAETLSSDERRDVGEGGQATITSLAGAVIAPTLPPPRRRTRLYGVVGASIALAGVVGFAVTRGLATPDAPPPPPEVTPLATPQLGLATIADYRAPRPATLINHRSQQVWLAARDDFARACKLPGAPAQWCAGALFATGELALIGDDVSGSIAAFDRATKTDPAWSTGFLGLADAHTHARHREEALAAARKAQELDPTGWQPAMASARALISADEVDDALIEYRRALAAAPPNDPVILGELALAFHFAGKDAEARSLMEQAFALDPSLVNVRIVRAELALEEGAGERALVEAEAALAVSPKNGAALMARGDALVLLGRGDEALVTYRRMLQVRGGMNLLAISRVRLATVEAALGRDELPPARGSVEPARSPAAPRPLPREQADERGPDSQPTSGEAASLPRTPPSTHPGPQLPSRSPPDREPPGPKATQRAAPSASQPEVPPGERSPPDRNKQPVTRTPPTRRPAPKPSERAQPSHIDL